MTTRTSSHTTGAGLKSGARIRGIAWAFAWALAARTSGAGDVNAPAEFVVTARVSVPAEQMLPIGFMNFCEPMGALKTHQNTVFDFPGNEPGMNHAFGLVVETQGGGKVIRLDGALQARTPDFYNGCVARVYRIVDKQGQPLPISTAKSYGGFYLDLANADHVIGVGQRRVAPNQGYVVESKAKPFRSRFNLEDGPEILPWDAVFIEKALAPEEETETRWAATEKADAEAVRISYARHESAVPGGADLGKACLRVDLPAGEHGVKQTLFSGGNDGWYGQLFPGQPYRLEVWLRQTGLGDGGQVTFAFTDGRYPEARTAFAVGGEWRKFIFDFTASSLPPPDTRPFGPAFWATGPGTLWVDNARIFAWYDKADLDKPFVPVRQLVEEIRSSQPADGPKGYLRSWAALPSRSIDSLLSLSTPVTGGFRKPETIPMHLAYCEATGDAPGDRMKPWITVNVFYTEEDWLALFEYLAAPYDPAKDTPQAKPWAYRRTLHRGNDTPWTDSFDKILIEFGNENWHNRANLEWVGFGRAGMIHGDGLQYGLWGRYIFSTVMEKSPYWKSQGLDRKIVFNLAAGYYATVDADGKPTGYGPDSIRGGWPTSRMSSMALYVGPRWELNEKSEQSLSDEVYQKTLLAYQMGTKGNVVNTSIARQKMKELGYDYDLVSYEGGPGGYGGGRQKSTEAEKAATVAIGRSLAMGLAAIDCYLDAGRYGFVAHCLYASNQGKAWSNHTLLGNGFRPTPAWQALTLRNRELRGDLLAVDETSVPALTRPVLDKKGNRAKDKTTKQELTASYPLARCYAFRQGDRWSVCLLSLKMPGRHDGQDFGNGATPCVVTLPFKKARAVTLFALEGHPRDTNEDELKIRTARRDVPPAEVAAGQFVVAQATGSPTDGLPAGAMYVYVFEGAE